MRPDTDAIFDGGLSRSSEEVTVMGVERRAGVVQLEFAFETLGNPRRRKPEPTRGIPITKQMVWSAYKKVRSNKGQRE